MYIKRFAHDVRQTGDMQFGWKYETTDGFECELCEGLLEKWGNGTLVSPEGHPDRLANKLLRMPSRAGVTMVVASPTVITASVWMIVDGDHFRWSYWGTEAEVRNWFEGITGIEPMYQ